MNDIKVTNINEPQSATIFEVREEPNKLEKGESFCEIFKYIFCIYLCIWIIDRVTGRY
jgi:hypothetical protein